MSAPQDAFTAALSQGPMVAAGAAFVGGLLTSLTPCVYPMIAITVSVFGAKQARSRTEAMLLSTAFVLGIVALFTPMLMIAAMTGGVFGAVLQSGWVLGGISLLFILLALSMFGAYDMVLPSALMQRLSNVGGIGYRGAFLLGLVSGLIAAPCTGPVLTGILVWIGQSRDVVLGSLVGTAFSLGLGIPFWIVGTFAVALPKGGKWMLGVKSFFGIVMLIVALYFLKTALPILAEPAVASDSFRMAMAALVVVGLALGAVHVDWHDGRWAKPRKLIGIVATTLGGFLFVASADKAPAAEVSVTGEGSAPGLKIATLQWETDEAGALARAKAENMRVLIDFTADWCAACKKLLRITFADSKVAAELSQYVLLKVDATDDEDPKVMALMKKYRVVGLPTVVILDAKEQELLRINDFVEPEPFLVRLKGM